MEAARVEMGIVHGGNGAMPIGNVDRAAVEMALCTLEMAPNVRRWRVRPLEMESAFATEFGNKEKRSEDHLEVVAELPVRPPSHGYRTRYIIGNH